MKDHRARAAIRHPAYGRRFATLLLALTLLLLSAPVGGAAVLPDGPLAPSSGATFVVTGPGYDGVTLDPALATDGASLLIARQVYDTLLFYQDGGTMPVPGLATGWSVSADRLTWTFHVRPGVRFHDGTPLDANAVAANIRRWWDPANPYHQGDFAFFESLFFGFRGDPNCLLTDVSASGNYVVLTLRTPFSPLPSILAFAAFSIASPAAIASGTLATNPLGSGAFRFVERVPGDHVTLAANADYWEGAPYSSTLVFRAMNSATDRLNALRSGEVQVADVASAAGDPLIRTFSRGAMNIAYLGINRARSPFGNVLVRQAMAHLVNKATLAAFGPGEIATQFLPSGVWGRDPSITDYTFDPALARSLLAQAGYPSGFSTTLAYRNVARGYLYDPRATAQAIQADFARGGIELTLLEQESVTFLNNVDAGNVDLFLLGWAADYPHPDNYFRFHFCSPQGWRAFLPQDDALCAVVNDALLSDSLSEQVSMYQWVSRRVHDTVPVVPLLSSSSVISTRYDVVGVTPNPTGLESYRLARQAAADSTTVTPAAGGAVGYAAGDTFTSLDVPAGAVVSPTVVTIGPAGATDIPAELAAAGHAFEIAASAGARTADAFTLAKPAMLTVEYTGGDIARLVEQSLELYHWNGEMWEPAAATCSPAGSAALDLANKRVAVPVCQLGRFALFGEPQKYLYLPVIRR